jgi:hypothetical protein
MQRREHRIPQLTAVAISDSRIAHVLMARR